MLVRTRADVEPQSYRAGEAGSRKVAPLNLRIDPGGMPLTVAFANLKGGVGKTTLVLNCASALHRAGHRVLVVDADSQGSARSWHGRAAELGHPAPPVVGVDAGSLRTALPSLSGGFDVVLIDTPARLGAEARAAMIVSDLVVVPVVPGQVDLWALERTVAVLDEARAIRPVRAGLVLNRADRTVLSRAAKEAVSNVPGLPLLGVVQARVAIGEAIANGRGVVDEAPGSPAADEIETLTAALVAAATTLEVAA